MNCPSEPEQLQCLDSSSRNEALEATDLQPLSEDSVEQHTARKEACKLSLKAALSREFHPTLTMLLLKHTIEYLTNNGELDTSDRQRLLTTSLEKLAKSNLSDLKDCDCRKD